MRRRRGALLLAVLATVGGLVALTLGPLPMRAFERVVDLAAVVTPGPGGPSRGAVERLGNLLLLLPLGVLLALLVPRVRALLLVLGLGTLSTGIELVQLAVLPGRYPSLRDVLLNTVGAGLGVAAGRAAVRLSRRRA